MKTKSYEKLVTEFHEKFGSEIGEFIDSRKSDLIDLRLALLSEEFEEMFLEAKMLQHMSTEPAHDYSPQTFKGVCLNFEETLANLFKELGDLQYVLTGLCVTFGIPMEKIMQEIHRSNMSKLGEDGKPIFRADGKILKGPNYREANLKKIVNQYIAKHLEKVVNGNCKKQ